MFLLRKSIDKVASFRLHRCKNVRLAARLGRLPPRQVHRRGEGPCRRCREARRQPFDGVPPARPDRGAAWAQALRAPPHRIRAHHRRRGDGRARGAHRRRGGGLRAQARRPGDLAGRRAARHDERHASRPPLDAAVRRLLRPLPGRAARRGLVEPGAEPVEARRRRRDPRHRQPAGDARRPPRRDDRLGALRARRGLPRRPAASIS